MKYFCTHSDKNYLAKGIALYESIASRISGKFTLFYLCTDAETYEIVHALSFQEKYRSIKAISLGHVFVNRYEEEKLRSNPACLYGDQYSQFCWSLTPYFTWWLMVYFIPDGAGLLYCDADLYFYHSPEHVFRACQSHDVGIHRHRFSSYDMETNSVGEFNVGCVFFRNTAAGLKVAEFWKSLMQNPQNEYAAKYGTCGDQKYWDLLYPMFREHITIFDPDGENIGHGAPWNFSHYNFESFGQVRFKGVQQLLVFNHFSHFNSDGHEWRSSNNGEWRPEDQGQEVRQYYEHYFREHRKALELIERVKRDAL